MTDTGGGIPGRGCAFCGRARRQAGYLVLSEHGNICADCIELGLQVARDGQARESAGDTELTRLRSADDPACDLCGRSMRLSFLGFRRTLARMTCARFGSVMCLDCLDSRGDLVNSSVGGK